MLGGLLSGYLHSAFAKVKGPWGSTWVGPEFQVFCPVVPPSDALEKCTLELVPGAPAGWWTWGNLARPAPHACRRLQTRRTDKKTRGHRIQLCWHVETPKRFLHLHFWLLNSIPKSHFISWRYPRSHLKEFPVLSATPWDYSSVQSLFRWNRE